MTAVVQRVSGAKVVVDGVEVNSIGKGLLVFVGVFEKDTEAEAERLAAKISKLRIFCDDRGKMFYSVADIEGEILLISNFTLCANVRKGNRPEFLAAARPAEAERLYELLAERFKSYVTTKGGVFGGDMKIEAHNDGPVTVIVDSDVLS